VTSRNPEVVNLCFHGIGTPGRRLEPDEARYWVDEAQFEELLAVVARSPRLRVTFDDGNASDAAVALPVLERLGVHASFFVLAGRIGRPGSLGAADVRQLAAAGMTVGCHGLLHRSWRALDSAGLREELVEARDAIAEAAGTPVDQASCPFGAYDRRVLRALRGHGFVRVYTVDEGPARPGAWLQSRYTVLDSDTPASIERLGAGDDGLAKKAARSLRCAVKRWR
jgi:peptidoglycan/xylan/chitin deacetylase (PgdA/CDA1 family)